MVVRHPRLISYEHTGRTLARLISIQGIASLLVHSEAIVKVFK
jgi:hypothetical protein